MGLCAVVALLWRTQWGEFHGLPGDAWLRFWATALAPVVLGSTALYAARGVWRTLEETRHHNRRDEFWVRLDKAIELGMDHNLPAAQIGADMLAYIYADQRGISTEGDLELLRSAIIQVDLHAQKLLAVTEGNRLAGNRTRRRHGRHESSTASAQDHEIEWRDITDEAPRPEEGQLP